MNISPSLSHFIVLNFYVSLWLSLSFIPLTGTSWQPAVLLHQYRLLGKGEIGNLDRCSGWQDSPLTPVVSMVKHLSGMTSLYSIYFFFLSLYLSINHPPRYSAGSCCVMLGQKLACAGIHFLLAHFQPKAPFSCITIFASNKQLSTLGEHHLLITVSSCFSFFFDMVLMIPAFPSYRSNCDYQWGCAAAAGGWQGPPKVQGDSGYHQNKCSRIRTCFKLMMQHVQWDLNVAHNVQVCKLFTCKAILVCVDSNLKRFFLNSEFLLSEK